MPVFAVHAALGARSGHRWRMLVHVNTYRPQRQRRGRAGLSIRSVLGRCTGMAALCGSGRETDLFGLTLRAGLRPVGAAVPPDVAPTWWCCGQSAIRLWCALRAGPRSGSRTKGGAPCVPRHVWNVWIVYPIGGWALILGARAWAVYGHKPISEGEVQREIERQTRTR